MNTNLLFNFSVNKEDKTIHVMREFNANLALVWRAWTTAEILDQWWAPKPFKNKTKKLDFRVGGLWHYAMIGPHKETHWCRFDYDDIEQQKSFSGRDAFCDENGIVNADFSRMSWQNVFNEKKENTIVHITISMDTLETLEKIIDMGFQEGFTMGMQNLDDLLLTLKKQ